MLLLPFPPVFRFSAFLSLFGFLPILTRVINIILMCFSPPTFNCMYRTFEKQMNYAEERAALKQSLFGIRLNLYALFSASFKGR